METPNIHEIFTKEVDKKFQSLFAGITLACTEENGDSKDTGR